MSAPPLTILYLLDYTDFGGGETAFLALMQAMRRAGDAEERALRPVVVLTGEGPLARGLREAGVEVRVVAYPRRLRVGFIPWFDFGAARAIGAIIDEVRPAVVHAQNVFGLLYGGYAARRRGLPVVWTCHGWFDLDTRAKRGIALKYATHVACVSNAIREEALKTFAPERVTTDYLGIEPFNFDEGAGRGALRGEVRRELGTAEGATVIAVVARFQPIKGHALLLEALPRVIAAVPGVEVWLIGDALEGDAGEAANKATIEARVRAEGWEGCVRFLGARRDARRLMRGADLIAIPSARESFSMVAVEGLEAGVPVVGPDEGGPREIIDVPATGERFAVGDAQALAEAMVKALGRGEFDAEAGPRRVRAMFSAEAHLRRTREIYAGVGV